MVFIHSTLELITYFRVTLYFRVFIHSTLELINHIIIRTLTMGSGVAALGSFQRTFGRRC